MLADMESGAAAHAQHEMLDRTALAQYMSRHVAGFKLLSAAEEGGFSISKFSHGQSNPTYLLQTDAQQRYVLRKKPAGKLLPSAHAVEREYRVLAALQSSKVPVPKVYCLCTDESVIGTPFYIMEYVEGRILTNPLLPECQPAERRALFAAVARTLAALHAINARAVGLSDYGRPDNYCARQVERWARQYEASKIEEQPVVDELISWLRAHVPHEDRTSYNTIVHGDFRLDNLVFHPTEPRVLAVLDWELSTLGNAYSDLSYACMGYRLPPGIMQFSLQETPGQLPAGMLSEQEFIAVYCDARGVAQPGPSWPFYLALSMFRAAAILAGVYRRALQGNASATNAAQMGPLVTVLATSALKVTKSSSAPAVARLTERVANEEDVVSTSGQRSTRVAVLLEKLEAFMDRHIYPAEQILEAHALSDKRWTIHPLQEELKRLAKKQGLWNLWLPKDTAEKVKGLLSGGQAEEHLLGAGLTNLEYAPLCEVMGRSLWAPEVFNCSAPDTGNMEVLARYASPEQQRAYLRPLLLGDCRSCFCMTEPAVASSDATNIGSQIQKAKNEYIVNGLKWWASGAMDPRCKFCIFMGKTDISAPTHKQQSMLIVLMDTSGLTVKRPLTVFGFDDAPHGHAEVSFDNVRVPCSNLILGEGRGFEIAQGRLGPGRLHHCMRLVGAAERALTLAAQRSLARTAFGSTLSQLGSTAERLATCRIEVDSARLLVRRAAHALDAKGFKGAQGEVAAAKVAAPRAALLVVDHAIQIHGGAGVSGDFPLAHLWAAARTLRIADGPDEVHLGTLAKLELRRAAARTNTSKL
eukprot:jgi/Chlat1/1590/Chrsp124S01854